MSDVDHDDFDDSSMVASDDSFDDLDGLSDHADDFSADVKEAINNPIELSLDFYAQEGLDTYRDNEYLNTASSQSSHSNIADDIYPFGLSIFKRR